MIARIWHGRTPAEREEAYADYVRATGLAAHRRTEGNRGSYLLRRSRDGIAEFIVLSLWDSLEAIRRFAGPEPEKAVYFPEDDEYLLEREPEIQHWEVVDAVGVNRPEAGTVTPWLQNSIVRLF